MTANKLRGVIAAGAMIAGILMPMSVYAADDDVTITLTGPDGWVSAQGEVNVEVKIKPDSGVEIKTIEAKQDDGKWTDISDTMTYLATDNGTVSVRVKDVDGKTYENSLELSCFDKELPTLIAAVNRGVLHIQAQDAVSGIKNVYVNGYTFADVPDGDITIRLQQFDATYADFKIQVTDHAGNISDTYTVENPYVKTDDDSDLSHYLPEVAIPTDEEHSIGSVLEYSTNEVEISGSDMFNRIEEMRWMLMDEDGNPLPLGKEVYTIGTASGKTFYMIIDRSEDENNAYLLTQAGEADILNFVQDDEEKVLPQNAAVVSEHTLTVGNKPGTAQTPSKEELAPDAQPVQEKKGGNSKTLLMVGGCVLLFGGALAYLKLGNKKPKVRHDEDEDEDDNDDVDEVMVRDDDREESEEG